MEEIRRAVEGGRRQSIRWSGFESEEVLEIKANSLRQASVMLGAQTSRIVRQMLRNIRWDYGENGWSKEMDYCYQRLEKLEELARSGVLTVNGVNYLARYLDAFEGFCSGAEISRQEGAYLQMERFAGCQTLFVQDADTKEVRVIHTEEDADYIESANGAYRYRLVIMTIGDVEVHFFAYPGLCGWGPAFGVNETTGLLMAVDDLYIKPKYSTGVIWANALAFMIFDAGELNKISELLKVINQVSGQKFDRGYAVHLASLIHGNGVMRSIEFANDKIRIINPVVYQNRLIVGQSNCPINLELQQYSEASLPEERETWTRELSELYVEMNERRERLIETGMSSNWLGLSANDSIRSGLEMLADPYGDLGRYIDNHGRVKYFTSGLPSRITVAHMSAYLGKNEIAFYAAKFRPNPIVGKEYSTRVNLNYKYALKKIWEEAERVRRDYLGRVM